MDEAKLPLWQTFCSNNVLSTKRQPLTIVIIYPHHLFEQTVRAHVGTQITYVFHICLFLKFCVNQKPYYYTIDSMSVCSSAFFIDGRWKLQKLPLSPATQLCGTLIYKPSSPSTLPAGPPYGITS